MNNVTGQYLVGYRFGPCFPESVEQALDRIFEQQRGARELRRTSAGRRVVQMEERQSEALAQQCKEAVIEPDTPLQLFAMPGLSTVRLQGGRSYSIPVRVVDQSDLQPMPGVSVFGVGASGVTYEAITDEAGSAVLQTYEPRLRRLIASPPRQHWSRFVSDVDLRSGNKLTLELKPLLAAGAYDWGHRLMGFRMLNDRYSGREVKIAIVDSGVGPAADLMLEQGVITVDVNAEAGDEHRHGTHVCGILGARDRGLGMSGAAPGARIYPVKASPGGRLSNLIEGIEWCIRQRMDVVCIGMGARVRSQIVAAAIRDAYDRGIVCVAAAGNDSSTLALPAALPTTVAVGAIGRFGTFPEDSAHQLQVGSARDWYGGLFAANFSNSGEQMDVCAPGVAILSTVPDGYASWDGTSMACAFVTALVALILEAYPYLRTGDARQVESVRKILHAAAVDLGMPPSIQGRGLPMASRVLQ